MSKILRATSEIKSLVGFTADDAHALASWQLYGRFNEVVKTEHARHRVDRLATSIMVWRASRCDIVRGDYGTWVAVKCRKCGHEHAITDRFSVAKHARDEHGLTIDFGEFVNSK
jgi:hypothetical protein